MHAGVTDRVGWPPACLPVKSCVTGLAAPYGKADGTRMGGSMPAWMTYSHEVVQKGPLRYSV